MKIVFVDFDGVLNHYEFLASNEQQRKLHAAASNGEFFAAQIDPRAVARLNRLLDLAGAVVVVSSSWRNMLGMGEIQRALRANGFEGKIIDKTPSLDGLQRGDEIKEWLDREEEFGRISDGKVESFVALDDDVDMDAVKENFVHVDGRSGLQDEHITKALQILGMSAAY